MNNIKRGRGRPKGTGRPDGPRLNQVADLMIANPELRPTTAIKRTNPAPGESDIRRLQEKWRAEGEPRLEAARERLAAAQEAQAQRSQTRRSGSAAGNSLGALASLERRIHASQRLLDIASGTDGLTALDRAARGMDRTSQLLRAASESPLAKQMRALEDSPVIRAARAMHDSPVMKAARALEDSPAMRAAKGLDDNPTMRLLRQMQDSPALRLSRELDRLRRYGL